MGEVSSHCRHFLTILFPKYPPSLISKTVRCRVSNSNGEGVSLLAVERAGGGKMVAEVVGAFNQVTERMKMSVHSAGSSRLIFDVLKLCIPIFHSLPVPSHGRSPLSMALSLAILLADLQMDAEVISVGILRHLFDAGAISIQEVRDRVGVSTSHLLYESLRLKSIHPSVIDVMDDEGAAAFRKFFLAYYDIRAIVLDLALKLDSMRHLDSLPRFHQQFLSLQVMFIYAPLAHAIGANWLSLELEDLAFHYLFPYSYLYVDAWLRSHESGCKHLIESHTRQLREALESNPVISNTVDDILIFGRFKSRYSTMKKLLRDGRKPEAVNDVLGLRVVLKPKDGCDSSAGEEACYKTREIIACMWKEIPSRLKDYIAKPKPNGYRSLHMAVDINEDEKDRKPLMEIQIRTTMMECMMVGGSASHSLYKAGLTDPEEAKRLKSLMMAAAEVAAARLTDFAPVSQTPVEQSERMFRLLDKNGDGKISIEELAEVMEELGATIDDAREMMTQLDSNNDGSLSSEEFSTFQKQIEFMRHLEDKDDELQDLLNAKKLVKEPTGLIQVYSQELGNQLARF